ncbi:MAG: hypothetical protein ACRCYC_15215 [Paraclostridium sp.]|uniref:hypothetical protein n=1 Tax=Paraclostridium sp. TaxID=2023273 RepID=UPI003F2D7C74
MKKIVLWGSVVCVSLVLTACNGVSESQHEKEVKSKKEEQTEEKFLTKEEMEKINENVVKTIKENTKYKFAKIMKIQDTKIDVAFLNTPEDYDDKGYNDNLDIDTTKLKETGENANIDLIGVDSNMLFSDIKEGIYVRIGTYEPKEKNEIDIEDSKVISVDKVN